MRENFTPLSKVTFLLKLFLIFNLVFIPGEKYAPPPKLFCDTADEMSTLPLQSVQDTFKVYSVHKPYQHVHTVQSVECSPVISRDNRYSVVDYYNNRPILSPKTFIWCWVINEVPGYMYLIKLSAMHLSLAFNNKYRFFKKKKVLRIKMFKDHAIVDDIYSTKIKPFFKIICLTKCKSVK